MTCKDCVHYEVCHLVVSLHMDADEFTGKEYNDLETSCSHFQNNSCFAEVVRCKDCIYAFRKIGTAYVINCLKLEKEMFVERFCSYGERKINDA